MSVNFVFVIVENPLLLKVYVHVLSPLVPPASDPSIFMSDSPNLYDSERIAFIQIRQTSARLDRSMIEHTYYKLL